MCFFFKKSDMNIDGNNIQNPFDQDLNTYDNVDFTRVDVSGAIIDNSQLATKYYVDTHGGGGGGGNMTYTGTTPATNYIYKALASDGHDAVKSTITDNGATVTIGADCVANKFVKSGGTAIQYLMGDGSTLTQSATSGNSNFYLYQSKNGITTPPPVAGDVGYNNAVQASATIVYISHLTRDNIDIEVFYNQVNQLNDLYIQDQNNSVNFIKYNITGLPSPVINSYTAIPVLAVSSGGTGATSFGANHNVLLAFFSNLTEIDTRLSTLETKTINQTAVAYATTFTGQTNFKSILTPYNQNLIIDNGSLVNTISSYAYNESVLCALEINSLATEFNGAVTVNNSVTASSFIKTSGLSSQFLKANGTVDATTYLPIGTPGIVSGYPFNPVWRATATITSSTKSYWFVVLLNQATLISGFSVYLDSGSDVFRMGIYRGKVSAGTVPMTLCGQSAGGTLPTADIYSRVAITAVSGQNLTFANGEYMTIAFHSQGSTNVFLTGQTTVATWVELGYNSTTNYAAAGFPATLTSTSVLGAIPNRPCFELY